MHIARLGCTLINNKNYTIGIDELDKHIDLQVDGGINQNNAAAVIEAGADVLVAGSATFSGGSYGENISSLRSAFDKTQSKTPTINSVTTQKE